MHRNRRTCRINSRGFALVFALFITVLLLVIGLALLSVSQNSALATLNVERKEDSFDAAEAGLNTAIAQLDASSFYTASNVPGALANKYTYTYTVVNNLNSGSSTTNDPVTHATVTVPASRAFIYSTGQGPNGERPTTVEAIVRQSQLPLSFPNYAIIAGLDIAGNWNLNIGIAGSSPGANNANIHANHNVTVSVGFLQGIATASGLIDTLNSGPSGINGPQISLPTAQMPAFVAYEKSVAQAGGPYALYIPATGTVPAIYNCGASAPATGCTVFLDGPLSISGKQTITFTGHVTFVVNGNYTATGQSQISFQQGTKSLFAVNGNADDGGLGTMYALIWAEGDVTLHGNGFQKGAVVAGGNVWLKGGGSKGGFVYDPSLNNFSVPVPGLVIISTFGEY